MPFEPIAPLFAAVKPLLESSTPVWVKCDYLDWNDDSKVRMRPDEWKGAPLPPSFGDDGFDYHWKQNPWISAGPCVSGTIIKGTLAYQQDKTQFLDPQLGHNLLFKPEGAPALTGFIWAHNYRELTTAQPAGWQNTLPQQYAALLAKAEQQKALGLW